MVMTRYDFQQIAIIIMHTQDATRTQIDEVKFLEEFCEYLSKTNKKFNEKLFRDWIK